jgi:hypothetical protein
VIESLLDILSDIIVQSRIDVVRLIWLFNLFDPHVKWIEFLLDQVIKVIWCVEDPIDGPHKERKESKSEELESNWKDIFTRCFTRVVTIAYGCDYLENPIEWEDVLRFDRFFIESLCVHPRLCAVFIIFSDAIFELTKEDPEACHDVADVDDIEN